MAFDFQELTDRLERFSSSRLALRPLCLADAWPLYQASRHPQFNENLAWDRPADIEGVVRRLQLICAAARRGELTALAAVVRDTGEWVSLFRFFLPMDKAPGVLEMGIWTHERFWNGRHSLDLGRLCVDTAFRVSRADRLIGLAAPGNRGSRHLMRLCGMTERCQSFKLHESGRKLPTVQYEITREEWASSCAAESPFHEFGALKAEADRRPDAAIAVKPAPDQIVYPVPAEPVAEEETLAAILTRRWRDETAPVLPAPDVEQRLAGA